MIQWILIGWLLVFSSSAMADLVTKPGFVAVDHVQRKAELAKAGLLDERCWGLPLSPGVIADVTHSTDNRYNDVSRFFRDAGATCLANDSQSCRDIRKYALEWARSGGPSFRFSWGSSLTLNMRLLNPMISALAIAEADKPLAPDEREELRAWLKATVDASEHGMRREGKYEGRKHGMADGAWVRKAAHNHSVQSSLAAMSYGAWTGNDEYFQVGIDQWFITLESARKDGSLPIETRRGAAALYYHGRTITALIQIAERARVQGIDLYSQAPDPGQTIHHVVKFMLDAMEDQTLVHGYASANHAPRSGRKFRDYTVQSLGGLSSTLGFVVPYMRQFPDHANTTRMKNAPRSGLMAMITNAISKGGYSSEWIGVDAKCFYSGSP